MFLGCVPLLPLEYITVSNNMQVLKNLYSWWGKCIYFKANIRSISSPLVPVEVKVTIKKVCLNILKIKKLWDFDFRSKSGTLGAKSNKGAKPCNTYLR